MDSPNLSKITKSPIKISPKNLMIKNSPKIQSSKMSKEATPKPIEKSDEDEDFSNFVFGMQQVQQKTNSKDKSSIQTKTPRAEDKMSS